MILLPTMCILWYAIIILQCVYPMVSIVSEVIYIMAVIFGLHLCMWSCKFHLKQNPVVITLVLYNHLSIVNIEL